MKPYQTLRRQRDRNLLQRAAAVIAGFLAADVWQGDISPEDARELIHELLVASITKEEDDDA